MVKTYHDGLFTDEEYHRQKKLLEMELEQLVVPAEDASEDAGKITMNLKNLWDEANLEEKNKLLLTMLDAVCVDAKKTKSIVVVRPKPQFNPSFQVAAANEGSDIRIVNESLNETGPCFWWRRERVELPQGIGQSTTLFTNAGEYYCHR